MKAWLLHNIGDLRFEEVNKPVPVKGEVLIRVEAVGICGSDIPRIYRDGAHKMPLIPGHEFAGTVVETGLDMQTAWLNKRVGIFPLIPCNQCISCKKGRHEMCRSYSYLGSRRDGGFAEYTAVPEQNLIELPETVSFEQAAMLEPMAVAVHAMRRINILKDDAVVVCGLGTIGLLLTMLLKERGISDILVIGNKDYQKQKALSLGIKEEFYCDSRSEDAQAFIKAHTNGGADVFFECVGKNDTVNQAVDMTCPGGRICLVGNPYSDIKLDKQTYWRILRNQLELTGTWNSSFYEKKDSGFTNETDWEYALRLLAERKIHPEILISHRLSLNELESGMRIMRDKSEDYVKIMAVASSLFTQ